uniref:Uncharacterized protein n=1 Tax=Oryza barthii TaxID=65489 RepID=A0A0D3HUK6_9ORYZ
MDPNLEKVSGLMQKMNLSESERRRVKVGGALTATLPCRDPQAVVKVVDCKELGNNRFLVTFRQASGKRKALNDGPWMFGKDLLVVVEFDGAKLIDEMEFLTIPIWVWVMKMPLGLMTRSIGESVGDMIGEVIECNIPEF